MASLTSDDVPDPFGLEEPELESERLQAAIPELVPSIVEPGQPDPVSGGLLSPSIPEAEIALDTPQFAVSGLTPVPTTTPLPPFPRTPLPAPVTDDVVSSSEDDEEWPQIPSLVSPTMFLPIPNVRSLSRSAANTPAIAFLRDPVV